MSEQRKPEKRKKIPYRHIAIRAPFPNWWQPVLLSDVYVPAWIGNPRRLAPREQRFAKHGWIIYKIMGDVVRVAKRVRRGTTKTSSGEKTIWGYKFEEYLVSDIRPAKSTGWEFVQIGQEERAWRWTDYNPDCHKHVAVKMTSAPRHVTLKNVRLYQKLDEFDHAT